MKHETEPDIPEDAPVDSDQRAPRVNFIGAPEFYNLNAACLLVTEAFHNLSLGTFHVGSSITRRDYRDVDVRVIMRLPSITCDGCGVVLTIVSNPPPKWFLDGRAKPGWQLLRHEERDGRVRMRSDYCPACKAPMLPRPVQEGQRWHDIAGARVLSVCRVTGTHAICMSTRAEPPYTVRQVRISVVRLQKFAVQP